MVLLRGASAKDFDPWSPASPVPRLAGENRTCRCEWRRGCDHRRESVVQTGAASNLGHQPDTPARGRTDVRGWGAFAPSGPRAHARGHLELRPRSRDFPRLWPSQFVPWFLGVGSL